MKYGEIIRYQQAYIRKEGISLVQEILVFVYEINYVINKYPFVLLKFFSFK